MTDDYKPTDAEARYAALSPEERAFTNMTQEQRNAHIDRMKYAAAKAAHEDKQAALQAKVAAATEVSLKGNQWYQMQQRGELNQRATVSNGKIQIEQINAKHAVNDGPFRAPPQALVDRVPIFVGGIQLGPTQAKEMLASGGISRADYEAGLNEALAPYGYGSFR